MADQASQAESMGRITKFCKEFWDALDIMKLLAILIVGSWLVTILAGYPIENETLKNIVLVIAGFLWGSSQSSRKKDDAIASAIKSQSVPPFTPIIPPAVPPTA